MILEKTGNSEEVTDLLEIDSDSDHDTVAEVKKKKEKHTMMFFKTTLQFFEHEVSREKKGFYKV